MMVCRLVANLLATAETLIPAARSSRTSCLCLSLRVERLPTWRDCGQNGRVRSASPVQTGEIQAAKCEVVNPYSYFGQRCDRRADIDGIAAEMVGLGYDQHITRFQPIHKPREAVPLGDGRATGSRLDDDLPPIPMFQAG